MKSNFRLKNGKRKQLASYYHHLFVCHLRPLRPWHIERLWKWQEWSKHHWCWTAKCQLANLQHNPPPPAVSVARVSMDGFGDVGFLSLTTPWKLTCPRNKRDYFSREFIFQTLIFGGYASFREGIMSQSLSLKWDNYWTFTNRKKHCIRNKTNIPEQIQLQNHLKKHKVNSSSNKTNGWFDAQLEQKISSGSIPRAGNSHTSIYIIHVDASVANPHLVTDSTYISFQPTCKSSSFIFRKSWRVDHNSSYTKNI